MIRKISKIDISEDVYRLHPLENRECVRKRYFIEKYKLFFIVLGGGCLCSLMLFIAQIWPTGEEEPWELTREVYGAGSRSEELLVTVPGILEEEGVEIYVNSRKYSVKEAEEILNQAVIELEHSILGENESLDEIHSDLILGNTAGELPVTVVWSIHSHEYIERTGKLRGEVPEEGAEVLITAILTCQDAGREVRFEGKIVRPDYTEKEKLLRQIRTAVQEENERTETQAVLTLPEEADGHKLMWSEKRENRALYVLLLGCVAAALLLKRKDEEVRSRMEQRKKQMLSDYPEITGKLILFLEAGMPVKNAWAEIVNGYQKRREEGLRFAYEEMLLAYHEMQSGVAERVAYESFGKRCRVQQYRKLSALLIQNMRKGTRGLAAILHEESVLALEERKAAARKAGEEAGTKLLVPMFLMLVVVLIIVIVPAFISIEL